MSHLEEETEKARWREEKYKEFRAELEQNEKLKEFLKNAYPTSHEDFISSYAQDKVRWVEYGAKKMEWLEKQDLHWFNETMERLKEILQKKLFDLQCQWRAEKVVLPGVRISHDFYHWEDNILECPFLEPVTEQEVDIYLQYLQGSNFEAEQGWLERWQDYHEIKEAYESENENRNFPDWYDFHNGRTGASVYMLLPDIRGQKEEFYLSFWRKELHAQNESNKKMQDEVKKITEAAGIVLTDEGDKRPYLDHHKNGWLTWFVKTYEDKETQQRFENYGGERTYSDYDEFIDNDLRLLALSEEPVPIEAWFDWKEALHKAAEKFRAAKIIETFPFVYEQYKMNLELNISFSKKEKTEKTMDDYFANAILRGRELNGEKRDFEF